MITNMRDLKNVLSEIDDELLSATHIGVTADEPREPTIVYSDTRDLDWEQVIEKLMEDDNWKMVEQFIDNVLNMKDALKLNKIKVDETVDDVGYLICTSGDRISKNEG